MRSAGADEKSTTSTPLQLTLEDAVEYVIDRALWEAPAIQAHPLVNTATMVLSHADFERFLAATGHAPRVIDAVPGTPDA